MPDPMTDSPPLTAEEPDTMLDELAAALVSPQVQRITIMGDGYARELAAAILATLDAHRFRHPEQARDSGLPRNEYDRAYLDGMAACRSTHAPEGVAPEERLNVERLAEALQAWWSGPAHMPGSDGWIEDGGWLGDAAVLAAYLEPAATPTQTTEDKGVR